jgi:hypothetical protein
VKRALNVIIVTFLAVGLLSAASFESNYKPVAAKPKASNTVQLPAGGTLTANLYNNSQYKFTLRIPEGFVFTPSTKEDDKRGAEMLAGGNEKRQQALEAANETSTSLIDLTMQGPRMYRSVGVIAEDISSAPLVESGKDYINHVGVQLRASKMKFKPLEDKDENIDGRAFSTRAMEMQVDGAKIYQAYSATVIGRRALVLILTSESLDGLRDLMVAFKPRFLEPLRVEQKPDYQAAEESGIAYVKNGIYKNPFFKMNFRVPEGWLLREGAREAVRQRAVANLENTKAQQPAKKPEMEVLFIATPPESTNSVMMMAIPLGGSQITPAMATDSMIIAAQKRGFKPVSKSEEKKISGQRFSRSVLKGFASGLDVYQAYNAAVLRDHVVCFVVTANNQEELDRLLTISTKSLAFD